MQITLTPKPERKELIVGIQIGNSGRLLVAQVNNLVYTQPITLSGSGAGFVREVEAALQKFVPKPHFVYQVLSILRKAEEKGA